MVLGTTMPLRNDRLDISISAEALMLFKNQKTEMARELCRTGAFLTSEHTMKIAREKKEIQERRKCKQQVKLAKKEMLKI